MPSFIGMGPRAATYVNPSVGAERAAPLSPNDWHCPCGLGLFESHKHSSVQPHPLSPKQGISHLPVRVREISVLYTFEPHLHMRGTLRMSPGHLFPQPPQTATSGQSASVHLTLLIEAQKQISVSAVLALLHACRVPGHCAQKC